MRNEVRRRETELWEGGGVSRCGHTGEENWLHWRSWSRMAAAMWSSEATVLGDGANDVEQVPRGTETICNTSHFDAR